MSHLEKQFHHTVKTETKKIVRLKKKISPHFDEELIHTFRTRIKRFRAILRWQHLEERVFTKSFKKVYHAAGDIRDGQVLIGKLSTAKNIPPQFLLWLNARTSLAKKRWDDINDNDLQEWAKASGLQNINIRTQSPGSFYRKKLNLLKPDPAVIRMSDERLHRQRKAMKDIQYVMEWNEANNTHKKKAGSSIKLVKSVSAKAGEYMDKANALNLLNAWLRDEPDQKVSDVVRELQRVWQNEKRRERRGLLMEISLLQDQIISKN
jgi:CHAD domain-containing protein